MYTKLQYFCMRSTIGLKLYVSAEYVLVVFFLKKMGISL